MIEQPFDLVLVEWLDSNNSAQWKSVAEEKWPRPTLCQSVGWLVGESKSGVVVMPHLSDPDDYVTHQGCGEMTIPRVAITGIYRLNVGNRRKR